MIGSASVLSPQRVQPWSEMAGLFLITAFRSSRDAATAPDNFLGLWWHCLDRGSAKFHTDSGPCRHTIRPLRRRRSVSIRSQKTLGSTQSGSTSRHAPLTDNSPMTQVPGIPDRAPKWWPAYERAGGHSCVVLGGVHGRLLGLSSRSFCLRILDFRYL